MAKHYILTFFLGFTACFLLLLVFSYNSSGSFFTGLVSYDIKAPSDWVSEEDIILFEDHIVLRIDNATLSNYASTGSMRPLFDSGSNGIRIVPEKEGDIGVGDIISFRQDKRLIVHRVAEKKFDEMGVYFIAQGDNGFVNDYKIRFEDIEYITIGVIW
jgi:signal peptidase I